MESGLPEKWADSKAEAGEKKKPENKNEEGI